MTIGDAGPPPPALAQNLHCSRPPNTPPREDRHPPGNKKAQCPSLSIACGTPGGGGRNNASGRELHVRDAYPPLSFPQLSILRQLYHARLSTESLEAVCHHLHDFLMGKLSVGGKAVQPDGLLFCGHGKLPEGKEPSQVSSQHTKESQNQTRTIKYLGTGFHYGCQKLHSLFRVHDFELRFY